MFAASKTSTASSGYQISRSLRFNSADSAYLGRTPASAGNRKTWTWSVWIKRGKLVADADWRLLESRPDAGTYLIFDIPNTGSATYPNTLRIIDNTGTNVQTAPIYRDPSAWYHIVLSVDTTQATASNRLKIYVNNVQVTSFVSSTYPTQNQDTQINTTNEQAIGRDPLGGGSSYYDGLMTETYLIDGQQLTPSSFGETNAQTGVWQPKAYSGSYGTNGFYLNFSDNSNTTAATLGKDYSGNGNNWTPNNFSVTAGAGNDSLVDSPTSYGTDTGVGGEVRGNYATLNPLAKTASGLTLTNGNLDGAITTAIGTFIAYATIGMSSGKWYWEVTCVTGGNAYMIGIGKDGGLFDWQTTNGYSYFASNGNKYNNSAGSAYGATFTNGDVIGVALDMDAGTLAFYKNGTSQGTAFSSLTGTYFPCLQNAGNLCTQTYNFGQRPFAYTAPSGFKALCTQNLPTPTIGATSATLAGKYFNPVLYTGTGANQSITDVGFQPDWTWIKCRSNAEWHSLFDAVRGAGYDLRSNSTNAEVYAIDTLSSFNSTGFSLGVDSAGYGVNTSGRTYVGWNWKANGTGSTNTAGSITSTVSANTTSGFSVVTFTATADSGSIGHGLGVAPSMIVIKSRNNISNWVVYHVSTGAGKYLNLNNTDAAISNVNTWQNTTPTSTVFYSNGPFATGYTEVAYCFAPIAGYSAFGSYTGNGSADGPFVYTGFRPAYLMFKRTDSTSGWTIYDASRDPYNYARNRLYANSSDAESSGANYTDLLSNGFKVRDTDIWGNANGGTYIFMAFASNPFKYSLAR